MTCKVFLIRRNRLSPKSVSATLYVLFSFIFCSCIYCLRANYLQLLFFHQRWVFQYSKNCQAVIEELHLWFLDSAGCLCVRVCRVYKFSPITCTFGWGEVPAFYQFLEEAEVSRHRRATISWLSLSDRQSSAQTTNLPRKSMSPFYRGGARVTVSLLFLPAYKLQIGPGPAPLPTRLTARGPSPNTFANASPRGSLL